MDPYLLKPVNDFLTQCVLCKKREKNAQQKRHLSK